MTKTNVAMLGMAAGLLLAGWGGAQVMSAESDEAALDTRSLSAVASVEDAAADTRTHTEDWSGAVKLNTKKIIGTMILVR
ncbi:MAG: hypothetical protein PHV28_10540 [Kiritimatiellae bacterium]|nr:hypothetical protein [Kiritimatiellia bacterium]